MRLLCWADRLNEYQFDVVYRFKADVLSDILSCPAVEASHETSHVTLIQTEVFICTIFGNAALNGLHLKDIADATAADKELSIVFKRRINGWIPADRHNKCWQYLNTST